MDGRRAEVAAGLRVEHDGEIVPVQLLKAADPAPEIVVVSRPGWLDLKGLGAPVFITPGGEVRNAPANAAIELFVNARLVDEAQAGNISGWRAAVEAALDAVTARTDWSASGDCKPGMVLATS